MNHSNFVAVSDVRLDPYGRTIISDGALEELERAALEEIAAGGTSAYSRSCTVNTNLNVFCNGSLNTGDCLNGIGCVSSLNNGNCTNAGNCDGARNNGGC